MTNLFESQKEMVGSVGCSVRGEEGDGASLAGRCCRFPPFPARLGCLSCCRTAAEPLTAGAVPDCGSALAKITNPTLVFRLIFSDSFWLFDFNINPKAWPQKCVVFCNFLTVDV